VDRAREPPSWTWVVEKGDTLFKIAESCGVSLDEIVRLNQIEDPDRIEVGQRLTIPGTPGQSEELRRQRRELAFARQSLAAGDFERAADRLKALRRELEIGEQGSTEILVGSRGRCEHHGVQRSGAGSLSLPARASSAPLRTP
jgi:LysM repeat protein